MSTPIESRRQFDLIAFDWDGTLFDSTGIITRCIQSAVVDVGGQRPTDQAASYVIGMGLIQALAHAAPDVPPERHAALGERYRHHYVQHQNDISLFDGVLPLLADLKRRGCRLAVATESRRGLDEALSAVELKGCLTPRAQQMKRLASPTPDVAELMESWGCARAHSDGRRHHTRLQMALNAGCASLAVSYGAHEPAAFEALRPMAVAHSVAELQQWFCSECLTWQSPQRPTMKVLGGAV